MLCVPTVLNSGGLEEMTHSQGAESLQERKIQPGFAMMQGNRVIIKDVQGSGEAHWK